jgi:hypothetical protein
LVIVALFTGRSIDAAELMHWAIISEAVLARL